MTRMKDSGIEWIGEVPEEWGVKPIKYLVSTPVTDGPHETPTLYDEGIPFLSAESVKNGILDFRYKRGYISETAHKIFSRKVSPQKNDIFIVKSGATTGNVGIVNTDEIFDIWSPLALVRTRSDLANQKFVYYFMLSYAFTKQIQNKWSFGTQQNIGMGVIEKIKLVVPPLDEQTQIADFLDKKVAQLDKVKSLLEEQIKTLEDYRQSLIYETVTKGLDKTVPLKDSGVDWIGQIPEGWGVGKLSQFFGEVKKKNVRNFEKNLLSLSYGRVIRKSIENLIGLLPESFETYNVIDENDIVFRLTDLQNDKKSLRTGLSKERGIITSAYITIRTTNNFINANYFNHLFYAYDLCKVYYNFGGGVRQGGTWGDLSVLRILIPPIMEQIQIADFLDKKTEQINQMIAIKKEQIENINKRRQTLIYDYVTGKRRV